MLQVGEIEGVNLFPNGNRQDSLFSEEISSISGASYLGATSALSRARHNGPDDGADLHDNLALAMAARSEKAVLLRHVREYVLS